MAAPTTPNAPIPRPHDPADAEHPGFCLTIAGPHLHVAYPLPRAGTLSIGRAEEADIRIPDPGISRRHALIHVRDGFWFEDLGSHNGSFVHDARVEGRIPIPVEPGVAIGLGATLLTIQQRLPGAGHSRLTTHAQLEARLIEECAASEDMGRAFALVRLDIAPGPGAESAEGVLLDHLRLGDVCALYARARYELLLIDTDPEAADTWIRKVHAGLASAGLSASSGAAYCPLDGRSPGALFAKACAAVRGKTGAPPSQGEAVVEDPAVKAVYQTAQRAAQGTLPILIHGETGVGKELLAAAVHRASPRTDHPFVTINCAAVAESVLESELFGHERGAFTGATASKAGLFESASGGTIFLDEVGEMSAAMQAKLLRVLEAKQIQRVGATQPRSVDVRVVSATNRDLDEEVAAGRFRADLFYRLNGMCLVLPPLRDRPAEIEPIARLVVEKTAQQLGRAAPEIDPDVVALLRDYPWPGNIRELRNTMERATLLCEGSRITLDHLPTEKMRLSIDRQRPAPALDATPPGKAPAFWTRRAETEKATMREALERCRWNRTRAAELLGMPRSTFMRKLAEMDLLDRRPKPAARAD